jgi:hypothetical protein
MCFSATASFVTAALTGAAGLAALRRAKGAVDVPLAAIPLIFSVQQVAEGALWLALEQPDAGTWPWILTQLFLVFALVVWPVYAPATALALEPPGWRRHVMQLCGLFGVAISAFFAVQLVTVHHEGYISGHHILYRTEVEEPLLVGGVYIVATGLSLLLSSARAVSALGLVVFAGSLIAWAFYAEVFVSVWCFFAAASSFVILTHFEVRARQERRAVAT